MFSVALIGPDGVGKTTIGRQIESSFPLPIKYLYMGVNPDASNHMLPTTRLIHACKRLLGARPDTSGPPDPDRIQTETTAFWKRPVKSLRKGIGLVNRILEEWFRQAVAWYYQRKGFIVLFDRHYFPDFYTYDIEQKEAGRSLSRRIHGMMLANVYPKPELLIFLDAPGEVLFARKGEGTPELLDRRRQDYLQIRDFVKHFSIVDANKPVEEVSREVTSRILDLHEHLRIAGARA